VTEVEALNGQVCEFWVMKRVIINGDPGIRKGGIIQFEDEEVHCFSVTRNGDYHGPSRVQLWCVCGDSDEFEAFEKREFIPHFLDTVTVEAEEVTVIREKGGLVLES
jgi:hypothetical protein